MASKELKFYLNRDEFLEVLTTFSPLYKDKYLTGENIQIDCNKQELIVLNLEFESISIY